MANYPFDELLSPLDFEYLIKDLLSRDLGVELTSFAEGKDKGIDLRFSKNKSENIIIQCKRVKSISKKQLLEELAKMNKLKFKKYYLVTSCNLSVAKTNLIKTIFKKWMKDDKNIYSKNRLNTLLESHKDIHQKHHKLWLNSSAIFNSLINQPLFERAKSLIIDLKKDYKYYVKNESLNKAIEIVNKNQFIIISGIPGIGKTTLAKLLLWEYLLKGFEIIEIRKIIEGEQILIENSESKQVFYFDDFLGENFLKYDAVEGRSNDLIQFIKRIMNNKNKVLIMTTREYILKQAKEKYEKLDTQEIDINKYTLDLSSYSKRIKALILYNHLFYSGISSEHIINLIDNKTYKKIINHKNYSPRIIEQMTIKIKNVPPEKYSEAFLDNLDNPFGIWDKAFKNQISEGSKYTLFVLLSIGEPILLSEFKKVIMHFSEKNTNLYNLEFRPIDIQNYLRELEDSFIKLNITNKNNHFITFQNPSIKDFIINIVKDDKAVLLMLLSSVIFYNQLVYTINYLSENYFLEDDVDSMIYLIITNSFDEMQNTHWILSGSEYSNNKSIIEKIDLIKPFLQKTKNKKLEKFILQKFKTIDVERMYHFEEKKFISFFKDYFDKLNLDFVTVLSKISNHISWFENVRNFISLSKINPTAYNDFVEKNKDDLTERINSALKKDIEYADSNDSLDNLKDRYSNEKDVLFTTFNLSISNYISEIEEKKLTLEGSGEVEEIIELDDSKIESDSELNFNEEEYFKIELFQ